MRSLLTIGTLIILVALTGLGCTKNDANPTADTTNPPENVMALTDGAYQANTEDSTVTWSGKKAIMPPHTGKVNINFADLVVEDHQPLAGSITINMQSITSDEKLVLLEEHLKNEDFFAVETHPTSSFTLTDITATSLEPTTNYLATGLMKIRDIEKELSFPVTITQENDNVLVTGTIVIDRTDFDIRYNSSSFFENLGDALIENNFTLTLDLVFEKM